MTLPNSIWSWAWPRGSLRLPGVPLVAAAGVAHILEKMRMCVRRRGGFTPSPVRTMSPGTICRVLGSGLGALRPRGRPRQSPLYPRRILIRPNGEGGRNLGFPKKVEKVELAGGRKSI